MCDVDAYSKSNLIYANVFKIDYISFQNGGVANSTKTKINEFRANPDGNIEGINKNDNSKVE
ncbi:hypothetical protein D7I46_03395 [Lactococcus allomyrinae]|uniref:Uncharacterized protein n=1 Tax=Lactococcus allomyrinae TaxID=2419773 RepID=A0A387B930_9LACT|nr:hypothetical protein D7I46_03395 [Lactococcus allomyrinae]